MRQIFCSSILSIALFFSNHEKTNAQSPDWLWAKGIGGRSNNTPDAIVSLSVAVDALGNVYSTGIFNGIVDFDPGPGVYNLFTNSDYFSGIFILKLNAFGNFVWAKSLGGIAVGNSSGGGNGYAIAINDSGYVYTTGTFGGEVDFDPGAGTFNLTSHAWQDVFISKLDSSGNFIWAKAIGGTWYSYVYSIAVDASGYVYTTGDFAETADFDPGPGIFNLTSVNGNYNAFISKLDNSGNFVWAKALGGGTIDCYSNAIAVDAVGNVFSTGRFIGTGDFDPGAGVYNFTAARSDIYISKLNSAGNFVWAKQMVGTDIGDGNSVKVDAPGNVYIAGSFAGTIDFDPGPGAFNITSSSECAAGTMFILKLDNTGNFIWAKATSGTGCSTSISLALDASGNIYTVGDLKDTVDIDPGTGVHNLICAPGFDMDIFVAKYTNTGNFIWAKATGSLVNDHGRGIAISSSGNLYITGYFDSPSIPFTPDTLINTNTNYNAFITKLAGGCNTALSISITSGTISVCAGQSITFAANPTNGGNNPSYQWKVDGNNVGINSSIYTTNTLTNGQIVTCAMTSRLSCANPQSAISNNVTVIFNCTGVVSPANLNFRVYPNPSNQNAFISFNLGQSIRVSIDVFDMLGQQVTTLTDRVLNTGNQTILWNTKKMAAGVYFIRLRTINYKIAKKVFVLH